MKVFTISTFTKNVVGAWFDEPNQASLQSISTTYLEDFLPAQNQIQPPLLYNQTALRQCFWGHCCRASATAMNDLFSLKTLIVTLWLYDMIVHQKAEDSKQYGMDKLQWNISHTEGKVVLSATTAIDRASATTTVWNQNKWRKRRFHVVSVFPQSNGAETASLFHCILRHCSCCLNKNSKKNHLMYDQGKEGQLCYMSGMLKIPCYSDI